MDSVGPAEKTDLWPLDTESVHLQRVQVRRKRLVECPQGIVHLIELANMGRQRGHFVRELSNGWRQEVETGWRGG